jgi:hypothetical protein
MEIVIAGVVVGLGLAAGLVIAAGVLAKRTPGAAIAASPAKVRPPAPPAVVDDKAGRAAAGRA